MALFTVFGVFEDADMMTFGELIEAPNAPQAVIIASNQGVSVVAILIGDHTHGAFRPEYAGQFTCSNGMDGADEITDAERDAT